MTEHVHPERRKKLDELRSRGIVPYAHKFESPRPIAEVIEEFERENPEGTAKEDEKPLSARIAGRIMARRDFGKAMFLDLKDRSGRMQAYLRKNDIGDEAFDAMSAVDLGDFIGVEGQVGRTQKGETTIFATGYTFLTKSLRPLPEKWHGLRDVETRYRKRYVDLFTNDHVADIFRTRAAVIQSLRRFLDDRGFIEVETPMMHPIAGGAAARPFVTHHNALDMRLYLRVAPELYLKRLLVGGLERVYELNRNFRNEGISPRHNPEYTMLEAYCAYFDYQDLMDLIEEMICAAAEPLLGPELKCPAIEGDERQVSLARPWRRAKYADLFEEATGVGLRDTEGVLRVAAEMKSDVEGRDPIAVAGEIFEEKVEPGLFDPVFVYDYPAEISPLSKCRVDDPSTAERFELFARNMELVNAFSELNDPIDQEERFIKQVESKDEEAPAEVDFDYVEALEHGMPPAGGLGIGIDRLTMLFTGTHNIREVILFPLLRHQSDGASAEPDTGD